MIRINDHTSIKCKTELILGELRYALINGKILLVKIIEVTIHYIKIELNKTFSIRVPRTSIYNEKPQLI